MEKAPFLYLHTPHGSEVEAADHTISWPPPSDARCQAWIRVFQQHPSFAQQASSKIEVRLAPHYQFGHLALGGALSSAIEAFSNAALATERPSY
jgi:hypothetical protein